jgi:hypothetical protein
MSMQLIPYEKVRRELAEAVTLAEVRPTLDKAEALLVYAKRSKNTVLIDLATEVRHEAEIKSGELLAEMARDGTRDTGRGNRNPALKSRAGTPKLADLNYTKTESSKFQKLWARPRAEQNAELERKKLKARNATTSAPRNPKSEFTGENEWYTPKKYLDLAIEMFGEIDLCPASNKVIQDRVLPGVPYFSKDNSALTQEWKGRVWLNPPFAQPLVAQFTSKLVEEFRAGRVTEAIMLVKNATDTVWFHEAESMCAAICFTKGRVKFYNLKGDIAAPTEGHAFIYFGRNPKKFAKVFADVGLIR